MYISVSPAEMAFVNCTQMTIHRIINVLPMKNIVILRLSVFTFITL